MTSPLTGTALVSCAKSIAGQGVAAASKQCGYGDDTEAFMKALHQACQDMGITLDEFDDLITEQQRVKQMGGIEVAPDTLSDL